MKPTEDVSELDLTQMMLRCIRRHNQEPDGPTGIDKEMLARYSKGREEQTRRTLRKILAAQATASPQKARRRSRSV
jgi:hypothetical protein